MHRIKESWKRIPHWPRYLVSNTGQICRQGIRNAKQYNYLKINPRKHYDTVELGSNTGKRSCYHVDYLVASLFIPNPKHYKCVYHVDNDIHNNRADNLKWRSTHTNVDRYHNLTEYWKTIQGYKYYQVSNLGRVRHLRHSVVTSNGQKRTFQTQIIRRSYIEGYLRVTLYKNNQDKHYLVHRLVAKAFIPNPHYYPEVNHKNEKRDDDRANNLEWCTQKYNNRYGHHNIRRSLSNLKWRATHVHRLPHISEITSQKACQYLAAIYRHGREYWKAIPSCQGYYASNLGRIKHHHRILTPIVNQSYHRTYYNYWIYFTRQKAWQPIPAEQLVATTFLKNPHHYPQVNHINEEPRDNRAVNLEWCNAAYNNNYRNHIYHLAKGRGKHPIKIIHNHSIHVCPSRLSAVRYIMKTDHLSKLYYSYVNYRVRKCLGHKYPNYHGFSGINISYMYSKLPYDFINNLKLNLAGWHLTSPIFLPAQVR